MKRIATNRNLRFEMRNRKRRDQEEEVPECEVN